MSEKLGLEKNLYKREKYSIYMHIYTLTRGLIVVTQRNQLSFHLLQVTYTIKKKNLLVNDFLLEQNCIHFLVFDV